MRYVPRLLPSQEPFVPAGVAGIVPPMIGREAALQQLLHELYRVLDCGRSQLITVVGPAGIGKSRLAYEFLQVAGRLPDPAPTFTLQADRQGAARPYGLFRQLIASLFQLPESTPLIDARRRIEEGVAELLGPESQERAHFIGQLAGYDFSDSPYLRGVLAEPRQLRDRALHYVAQCLNAYAAGAPLLLLIDDLHNADDGSLDAFAQLLLEGEELCMLLVTLTQLRLYERRPAWGEHGVRLDLAPLDERASRRLLAEILRKAGKLPVDLRSLLVQKAEGNPFFLEELIKMLIGDGVIVPGVTAWSIRQGRVPHLRIPATLADVLRSRVQALTPFERGFLLHAAVVGRSFWPAAVQQLDDAAQPLMQHELQALLHTLEHHELIVPRSEAQFAGHSAYMFRHELLHEIAYALVPPDTRAARHRRVAAWLIAAGDTQASPYASLIADHLVRGGDRVQAAQWFLHAGTHAHAAYAVDAAEAHFRSAIALLPDTPAFAAERLACLYGLGEVQLWAARLGEAASSYREMAEYATLVGDLAAAATGWNGLAYVQDHRLEYQRSQESAQRAIACAEQAGNLSQLALGMFHLAWSELRLNRTQAALALGERATALLADADLPEITARWSGLLGAIHSRLGDYEASLRHTTASLNYYRSVGNLMEVATQLNNLGHAAHLHGDFQASLGFLREAERASRELGSRVIEIYVFSNLAAALNGLGQFQAAEECARRGITLSEQTRSVPFTEYYCALAEARLGQGDATEAVEAAQQALELARTHEGPREIAIAWRILGSAISALSAPRGAVPCFEESARLLAEQEVQGEHARTLRAWARHERSHGDPIRADALLREARAGFAQARMEHELAQTALPETYTTLL